MEHHFNVELASKYGVDEAIFCHNLYFWIKQNKANKRNFYKGTYWTYNTMDAYAELFPYWNKKQIERLITRCREKGLILTDNFNKNTYDRTLWYAVTNKVIEAYEPQIKIEQKPHNDAYPENGNSVTTHIPKTGNGNPENGTPIPDSKPDNKNNLNNINSSIDDDKRTPSDVQPHDEESINNLISNFREETKDDLSGRSFKAVVRKVMSKYNQGKVGALRDYLASALANKIFELELRKTKDQAKIELLGSSKQKHVQARAQQLQKVSYNPNPPFYNWLES